MHTMVGRILIGLTCSLLIFSILNIPQAESVVFTNDPCDHTVMSFNLLHSSDPQTNAVVALIVNYLGFGCIKINATGYSVTIADTRYKHANIDPSLNDKVQTWENGGYDAVYTQVVMGSIPNMIPAFNSHYTIENGTNWYNYNNATFDALSTSYQLDTNQITRKQSAYDMQHILYEDLPAIVILEDQAKICVYKAGLQGINGNNGFLFFNHQLQDGYKSLGYSGNPNANITYADFSLGGEYSPWSGSYSPNTAVYQNAIWQSLYEHNDSNGNWAPLLAAKFPEISSDGLTVNVTLNENATFANGDVLTAQDVYDSLLRFFNPYFYSSETFGFNEYFGDPTASVGVPTYRSVDQIVQITDNGTNNDGVGGSLSFHLIKHNFDPISKLMFPIVDSSYWGTWNNSLIGYDTNSYLMAHFNDINLMGTGPYYYDTISPATSDVKLKARTNYWNGNVAAKYFEVKNTPIDAIAPELGAGELDIIDPNFKLSISDINRINGATYLNLPAYSVQEISLNMLHPIFGTGEATPLGQQDPLQASKAARYVRQAISYLIPRGVLSGVTETLGTTHWLSYYPLADPAIEPYSYSIAKAKQLLYQAGYDTSNSSPSASSSSFYSKKDTSPIVTIPIQTLLLISSGTLAVLSKLRHESVKS